MTGPLLVALVAGAAALLLLPRPGRGVGRLRPRVRRRWRALRTASPTRAGIGAAMAAAVVTGLIVPGTPGLLAAPTVGAAVALGSVLIKVDRGPAAVFLAQQPVALEFLAVALDAGSPVAHAVETVAAVTPEPTRGLLGRVSGQLALGRAGPEAWLALTDHPQWGQIARDVARAEQSGTALADVLRTHADDIRSDTRDEAVKAARRVGVRSVVPLMVCFLPAFILVGVVPIIAGLLRGFFG